MKHLGAQQRLIYVSLSTGRYMYLVTRTVWSPSLDCVAARIFSSSSNESNHQSVVCAVLILLFFARYRALDDTGLSCRHHDIIVVRHRSCLRARALLRNHDNHALLRMPAPARGRARSSSGLLVPVD